MIQIKTFSANFRELMRLPTLAHLGTSDRHFR